MSEWITDRLPEFKDGKDNVKCIVTAVGYEENFSIAMEYCFNKHAKTEKGRSPRWKWFFKDSPWKVIAWQPLPEPYQP